MEEARKMICPACHRELKTKRSKFGDEIFPRHRMMKLGDYNTITHQPREISEELRGENYTAPTLYQLECPMSGKPVDL